MYFKLYRDIKKETISLPKAAVQLSGLSGAKELTLQTGSGFVLTARNDLTTRECVLLIQFLTDTAASLLTQLAVKSDAVLRQSVHSHPDSDELDEDMIADLESCGVNPDGLRLLLSLEETEDE